MAVFRFTVNQSFLENTGHPITVPKGQVPYPSLKAKGLNEKNVTIIFSRGERFEGQLYHGEAGYGESTNFKFEVKIALCPRTSSFRTACLLCYSRLALVATQHWNIASEF